MSTRTILSLQEAHRQQGEVNKDLILIPFYGVEVFEDFRRYCDKTGQTPSQAVAQFVRSQAALMKNVPANVPEGSEYGILSTYSDMGMEGYEAPVFFKTWTGRYNLNDMVMIGTNDTFKVFHTNGTVVFDGTVNSEEEMRYYCEKGYRAIRTPAKK